MLNDTQKAEVAQFVGSTGMCSTVYKVLLNTTKSHVPKDIDDLSDERIGQLVRAQNRAETFLNEGFAELERLSKVEKAGEDKPNPAR